MITKPKIILIGGGGHCRAVIDVIETENKYQIAGIVDIFEKIGEKILGYEIIASDKDIPELVEKYDFFFVTIGFIKSPKIRLKIFNELKKYNVKLPVIISPKAYVSVHSKIAEGTVIMHNVVVNANSKIGYNSIINTKALIEHDCNIGDNCHISTNSTINGDCNIGDECFIGSGVVTKQGINITSKVIIGAGAVVTKSINHEGVYIGNPAKKQNK
ncbi:MAG: acetyltransferase [Bacteroidales bacterium]|nr:acetyltransferase [Bacteroidales bacterium]